MIVAPFHASQAASPRSARLGAGMRLGSRWNPLAGRGLPRLAASLAVLNISSQVALLVAFSLEYQASSLEDQASSLEDQASSLEYQASSLEDQASSLEDQAY